MFLSLKKRKKKEKGTSSAALGDRGDRKGRSLPSGSPRLCKDQTHTNQQSEIRKRGLVSTGTFLEGFLERVGVGLDTVGCHNSPGQAWCRGGASRRGPGRPLALG